MNTQTIMLILFAIILISLMFIILYYALKDMANAEKKEFLTKEERQEETIESLMELEDEKVQIGMHRTPGKFEFLQELLKEHPEFRETIKEHLKKQVLGKFVVKTAKVKH